MSDMSSFGEDVIDRQKGFIRMEYLIDQSGIHPPTPKKVLGWAFETPGWPEFHACVRFDVVFEWDTFNTWQIDHFESGLACGGVVPVTCKEDAPAALANRLNAVGRERVHELLRRYLPQERSSK